MGTSFNNKKKKCEGTIIYRGRKITKRHKRRIDAKSSWYISQLDKLIPQTDSSLSLSSSLSQSQSSCSSTLQSTFQSPGDYSESLSKDNNIDSFLMREKTVSISEDSILVSDNSLNIDNHPSVRQSTFLQDMRELVINNPRVPHSFINQILKLVRRHGLKDGTVIPGDVRTLLKTPRENHVTKNIDVTNSNTSITYYYYFGIRYGILKYSELLPNDECINLTVHIDGIQADKSSGIVFWPILAKIDNSSITFPIAFHAGEHKPTNLESYLSEFVNEANCLITNGINIKDKIYSFKLTKVLGDLPARALILNIKGAVGYNSCLFCDVQGVREHGRTQFYLPENEIRKLTHHTHAKFVNQEITFLQKGYTPLMKLLSFDLIQDCPLDVLHLVYIGIVKRIIGFWTGNEKNPNRNLSKKFYMPSALKMSISRKMLQYRNCVPIEFNRTIHGITELTKWKGTNYRFFLLYVGIVVLKGNVSKEVFHNFLLLHFAIRALNRKEYILDGISFIKTILSDFVQSYAKTYGTAVCNANIHGLYHIADNVVRHGPLESFSTFPMESYLGLFRNLIHSPKYPAQQLVNRILERDISRRDYYQQKKRTPFVPTVDYVHSPISDDYSPKDGYHYYKIVDSKSFTIDVSKDSDNLIIADKKVYRVLSIIQNEMAKDIFLYVYELKQLKPYFMKPESSTAIGVYEAQDSIALKWFKEIIPFKHVTCKCVAFPIEITEEFQKLVVIEQLHE